MMLSAVIIAIQLICFVCGKVSIIPGTKLENCGDENAGYFDFSEFDLVPIDDEHVSMNGSWKFLKETKSPWKAHISTEKYTKGEWLMQAFDRKYDDFCELLHDITQPWAYVFEGRESCPIPAGTNWFFDMVPVKFPETLLQTIPPHYMGKWRFVCEAEFDDGNGGTKTDCKRVYADIFED